MTACQPTNIYRLYSIPVGVWLASDGGLEADQFPTDFNQS
jgi:hypothetical protein